MTKQDRAAVDPGCGDSPHAAFSLSEIHEKNKNNNNEKIFILVRVGGGELSE